MLVSSHLFVDLIKLKLMPHDIKESKTLNAIQVRIDDNVRMLVILLTFFVKINK